MSAQPHGSAPPTGRFATEEELNAILDVLEGMVRKKADYSPWQTVLEAVSPLV